MRKLLITACATGLFCGTTTAGAAPATLTSGEAFIDAFASTGAAASSVTIDERIDWDGTGSSFFANIDEDQTIAGTFSGFTIDNTITADLTQNTQIIGTVGGAFGGVSTTATATGSVEKNGPSGGSTAHFLMANLELAFTVNQPGVTYTLKGLLESTRINSPTSELSTSILLRRFQNNLPAETIIISGVARPEPEFPYPFDLSGDLTPGDWLLTLNINAGAPASVPPPSMETGAFSWDVDFVIIPEPATAVGLAVGTLALFRRRR